MAKALLNNQLHHLTQEKYFNARVLLVDRVPEHTDFRFHFMEHRDDRVYRSKRGVVHGLSLGMGDFILCGGWYRGVRVQ